MAAVAEAAGESEILLDPQGGHTRPLPDDVRIVGEAVEIDAEVAYLDDLHLAPAHVIEDQIGRRQGPVFDYAIEPESRMHCVSPLSPVVFSVSMAKLLTLLGENRFNHSM